MADGEASDDQSSFDWSKDAGALYTFNESRMFLLPWASAGTCRASSAEPCSNWAARLATLSYPNSGHPPIALNSSSSFDDRVFRLPSRLSPLSNRRIRSATRLARGWSTTDDKRGIADAAVVAGGCRGDNRGLSMSSLDDLLAVPLRLQLTGGPWSKRLWPKRLSYDCGRADTNICCRAPTTEADDFRGDMELIATGLPTSKCIETPIGPPGGAMWMK